jgi:hypothetical protein
MNPQAVGEYVGVDSLGRIAGHERGDDPGQPGEPCLTVRWRQLTGEQDPQEGWNLVEVSGLALREGGPGGLRVGVQNPHEAVTDWFAYGVILRRPRMVMPVVVHFDGWINRLPISKPGLLHAGTTPPPGGMPGRFEVARLASLHR